jgi:hypothetical protein
MVVTDMFCIQLFLAGGAALSEAWPPAWFRNSKIVPEWGR